MARAGRKRKSGPRKWGRPVQRPQDSTLPLGCSAVYVIWAERTNMLKVGRSRKPGIRCESIQVGNPLTVSVVGCHVMPAEVARSVERSFHKRHQGSSYHIRGEWYRLSPEEANRLVADEAARLDVDTAKSRAKYAGPAPISNLAYLNDFAL